MELIKPVCHDLRKETQLIEEHHGDACRCYIAQDDDNGAIDIGMQGSTRAQLGTQYTVVKEPTCKDGNEESTCREHDLRGDKVECIKQGLAKDGKVTEYAKGERTEYADESTYDGNYPSCFLAGKVELLMQVERHNLMHGDGGGECCQREQDIKHEAQGRGNKWNVTESLREYIGQGNEDEAGACIWIDTYCEGSREDDETSQDGHHGVYACNGEGRIGQFGIGTEIRGIGAKASHTQT